MIDKETLFGAIARGWCTPDNAGKVMDEALVYAIASAVQTLLATIGGSSPADAGGLTDGRIREVVSEAVRCGSLSWAGFEKDAEDKYTVPVLSPCHFQLARAIEREVLATKAAQPDAVSMLSGALNHARDALRFYAEQGHFVRHQSDKWDTVSGEPQNFHEDEANTATVEDGTVAKQALEDVAQAERYASFASLAPSAKPELPAILFDGHAVYAEVMANDPNTPLPTADNVSNVLDAVVRLMRRDAVTSASASSAAPIMPEKLVKVASPDYRMGWSDCAAAPAASPAAAVAAPAPAPVAGSQQVADNQAGTWLYDEQVIAIERAASAVESYGNSELSARLHEIIRDRNFTKATKFPPAAAAAPAVPVPAEQHPDDLAVERFAAAMKSKLAKKRAEGRGGWETPECTDEFLAELLMNHTKKGDPVDVANLAMMLHQRNVDHMDIAVLVLRSAALSFAMRVAPMFAVEAAPSLQQPKTGSQP